MSSKIYLLAPLSAINKRTRLAKIVKIFLGNGFDVSFFGWERLCGEAISLRHESAQVSEKTILKGGGYSSRLAHLLYPVWMLLVFVRVLLLGRKKTLYCLGWETAFPALLASFLTSSQVVFDDADRFSLIVRLPRPLHAVLASLEAWTSRSVLLHIVPGFDRYEWQGANMFFLRNTPLQEDFDAAFSRKIPEVEAFVAGASFVIYANGWLGETRGAPVLRKLAEHYKDDARVKFICAGRVDSEAGIAFIEMKNVYFMGEVVQESALSLYKYASVVITYYDPAVPINRKAESNKWGDALYFGVPAVVNAEVETARKFFEADAAYAVPYSDISALIELVEGLRNDPVKLNVTAGNFKAFCSDYPTFNQQFSKIIKVFHEKA